jgi:hypothetical protein
MDYFIYYLYMYNIITTQNLIINVDKCFLPKHANTHIHPTSTHIS